MRNYDFAPLSRSTVGFDRVFDLLDSAFTAAQGDEGYPPYNIVKTGETSYRIAMIYGGELKTLKANWLKRNMSGLPLRNKRKRQQPERLPLWKWSSRCGKPILSSAQRVV